MKFATTALPWCLFASIGILGTVTAFAQSPKLPLKTSDDSIVYVQPNTESTEKSVQTHGGSLGVKGSEGGGAHAGMDTSGQQPIYSIGASTGGDVSFTTDLESDTKKKNAKVKAGVTIRY